VRVVFGGAKVNSPVFGLFGVFWWGSVDDCRQLLSCGCPEIPYFAGKQRIDGIRAREVPARCNRGR
jgi:hypothetical protein